MIDATTHSYGSTNSFSNLEWQRLTEEDAKKFCEAYHDRDSINDNEFNPWEDIEI